MPGTAAQAGAAGKGDSWIQGSVHALSREAVASLYLTAHLTRKEGSQQRDVHNGSNLRFPDAACGIPPLPSQTYFCSATHGCISSSSLLKFSWTRNLFILRHCWKVPYHARQNPGFVHDLQYRYPFSPASTGKQACSLSSVTIFQKHLRTKIYSILLLAFSRLNPMHYFIH